MSPVLLPAYLNEPLSGEDATVSGWGVPGTNQPLPDRLSAVTVNVVSDEGNENVVNQNVFNLLSPISQFIQSCCLKYL